MPNLKNHIAGIVIIIAAVCVVLHEFVIRPIIAPNKGGADTEIKIDIDLGPVDSIKTDEKKTPRCC